MSHTDDALIERLRQGDRGAFDRIYGLYAERIHGFLLRLVRDPVVADDLSQDTWASFARAAGSLRDGSDLAAYLFTIARNQARSHRRWSLLDLLRLALPEAGEDVCDGAPSLELSLDAARAAGRLERALGALEQPHRELILLVCVEGFDQAQAASILGLSPAALRKRLSRGRAALAAALAAEPARAHAAPHAPAAGRSAR
jgi:RNA polymerase sigma factor (sigma-70 family)